MPNLLFDASTSSGYTIRILVDTLNFYLKKKGSFVVNSKGIRLCNTTDKEDVLCDMFLKAEDFKTYKCYRDKDICFSISLKTFLDDMLKRFKRKDQMRLQILEEDGKMFLKVIKGFNEDEDNFTRAPIVESKHIPIDPPTGYNRPVTTESKKFHNFCREVTRPNNKVITITCHGGDVLKVTSSKDLVEGGVTFGTSLTGELGAVTFTGQFPASSVIRAGKLATLTENIKIYTKADLPLYYKMNVGSLGEIHIYIKTQEQVRSEQESVAGDESDGSN